MSGTTYNGSRNYETFVVSVELTNNRGLEGLTDAQAVAREFIAGHEFGFQAAEAFAEWFAESEDLPNDGCNVQATMLNAFLQAVEWREVINDVLPDGEGI